MSDIIQLKITLQNTNPPIWRRIQVDKSFRFSQLHVIILVAMGWDGSHLYEFKINGFKLGIPFNDGWGDELIDASKRSIGSLIAGTKEKIKYTYDFGDSWEHPIKVEKFLPKDENVIYPSCIAGELNCPPEDCGGVWGFYNLLEIIANKKHPDHENWLEWLGDDYDPLFFDKNEVNEVLKDFAPKPKKKAAQRQPK